MSNQSTPTAAAKPGTTPIKPRATFAAASFANLRAATGEGRGEALRLLLADIDEDPSQPRTVFDASELESMAESIKAHGVVQPIVVQPLVHGRYRLVFGARRLRASRLAGVADIPAVVRAKAAGDFAAQLIENQQRANLSNGDLAVAIARLSQEGCTNKQVAAICSLKDYQVAAFRQVASFPPQLAARLDTADIRALYDLYRQWGKTPEQVIDGLPDSETFITVTEARRIIGSITGKPTGSIVLDKPKAAELDAISPVQTGVEPAAAPHVQEPSPAREVAPVQALAPEAGLTAPAHVVAFPVTSAAPANPQPAVERQRVGVRKTGDPVFIVAVGDGETGRLVVNKRAEDQGLVLVAYATGVEEVDATQLRIVRIE